MVSPLLVAEGKITVAPYLPLSSPWEFVAVTGFGTTGPWLACFGREAALPQGLTM